MSIDNNSDSPVDIIYCRYGCETRITCENKIVSFNNKKIPLNFLDRKTYEFPKRKQYNKTYAQRADLLHNIREILIKTGDNFESISSRNTLLKYITEIIEYDKKQQEQIIVNQNQINSSRKNSCNFSWSW